MHHAAQHEMHHAVYHAMHHATHHAMHHATYHAIHHSAMFHAKHREMHQAIHHAMHNVMHHAMQNALHHAKLQAIQHAIQHAMHHAMTHEIYDQSQRAMCSARLNATPATCIASWQHHQLTSQRRRHHLRQTRTQRTRLTRGSPLNTRKSRLSSRWSTIASVPAKKERWRYASGTHQCRMIRAYEINAQNELLGKAWHYASHAYFRPKASMR